MAYFLALASLLLPLAAAVPCVQFDTSWNLYAFGGSSDVNLGQSSSWASPSPQTLTTTGRPPWTGTNTQCLFSQYNNAMYVLGGDASDASKIYVYSFGSSSWSTQSTSSAPSNFGNSRSASVLDHDTNVLFTLTSGSGASLYQLDLSSVQGTASSNTLAWEAVVAPSFSTDSYTPVAAQASNHINYFGVPGTAAGSTDIFIVHFALFQNASQAYPTQNGGTAFPDSGGQAFSIPASGDSVPYQMVFVPNDFSQSYVVTHYTDPSDFTVTSTAPFAQSLINSTQLLPAPSSKDQQAAYAASPSALVQIDTKGDIYYINNAVKSDYTVDSSATWSKLSYSLAGVSGSSNSSTSASASASGASGSASASGTSASGSSRASGSATSGSASASRTSGAAASSSGAAGKKVGSFNGLGMAGASLGLILLGAALVL